MEGRDHSSIAGEAIGTDPTDRAENAEAAGCTTVAFDPDRELVDGAASGDRNAFEALLRRHYERIYRIAWRMTGSGSDAEDIAQDVCCTLVEKIGTFKGEAKFTTWLTGIVMNASRDHRRRGRDLVASA